MATVSRITIETKLPDDEFERAGVTMTIKPALDALLTALPEASITHKIVTERGTGPKRPRKAKAVDDATTGAKKKAA